MDYKTANPDEVLVKLQTSAERGMFEEVFEYSVQLRKILKERLPDEKYVCGHLLSRCSDRACVYPFKTGQTNCAGPEQVCHDCGHVYEDGGFRTWDEVGEFEFVMECPRCGVGRGECGNARTVCKNKVRRGEKFCGRHRKRQFGVYGLALLDEGKLMRLVKDSEGDDPFALVKEAQLASAQAALLLAAAEQTDDVELLMENLEEKLVDVAGILKDEDKRAARALVKDIKKLVQQGLSASGLRREAYQWLALKVKISEADSKKKLAHQGMITQKKLQEILVMFGGIVVRSIEFNVKNRLEREKLRRDVSNMLGQVGLNKRMERLPAVIKDMED